MQTRHEFAVPINLKKSDLDGEGRARGGGVWVGVSAVLCLAVVAGVIARTADFMGECLAAAWGRAACGSR